MFMGIQRLWDVVVKHLLDLADRRLVKTDLVTRLAINRFWVLDNFVTRYFLTGSGVWGWILIILFFYFISRLKVH